jgi:hypothetical protein
MLDIHPILTVFSLLKFQDVSDYVSPLQEQTEQAEAGLKLKVKGEKGYFEIPVCKADKRFFPFAFRGDEMGDNHGMVSEIVVENGTKFITLKSIIEIKNHYLKPVNLFRFDGKSRFTKLGNIAPDQTFCVPLKDVYDTPYEVYFQMEGNFFFKSTEYVFSDVFPFIFSTFPCYSFFSIFLSAAGSKVFDFHI